MQAFATYSQIPYPNTHRGLRTWMVDCRDSLDQYHLLAMHVLSLHLCPTESETPRGGGPAAFILTSLLGDSQEHTSLRITDVEDQSEPGLDFNCSSATF